MEKSENWKVYRATDERLVYSIDKRPNAERDRETEPRTGEKRRGLGACTHGSRGLSHSTRFELSLLELVNANAVATFNYRSSRFDQRGSRRQAECMALTLKGFRGVCIPLYHIPSI